MGENDWIAAIMQMSKDIAELRQENSEQYQCIMGALTDRVDEHVEKFHQPIWGLMNAAPTKIFAVGASIALITFGGIIAARVTQPDVVATHAVQAVRGK